MHKFNRGLEKFWLYFSIVVALFVVYSFLNDGVETGKYYLFFLPLPILMYVFRRFIRRKMEKSSLENKSKNKK